jgi:hypothetical protein
MQRWLVARARGMESCLSRRQKALSVLNFHLINLARGSIRNIKAWPG